MIGEWVCQCGEYNSRGKYCTRCDRRIDHVEQPKCDICSYFEVEPLEIVPNLHWNNEFQHSTIIEHDYDGKCNHEHNWRPSRGELRCDREHLCKYFNRKRR